MLRGVNMIKLVKSTFYREEQTNNLLCAFIKNAKQLSFGDECNKFESNFSNWQKRKHCVFLNSGSSANLAIVQSLFNMGRLKKGDKVGFSALTWSTNVMPLIQLGFKAIPVDVELTTLNISSKKLLDVLKNSNLKMLFLTNLLGLCDDIDKIREICKDKEIILIEDNCESLGTIYKGKLLGNYGVASTFSFYVGHHMSTIEGGAVCTDDEDLATMLRLVRAHGWDRNLNFAKQNEIRNKFKVNSTFYSRYTFYDLGYNLRPTEINGFIGNVQIKFLDEIIEKRNKNFFDLAIPIYREQDKYFSIKYKHIDFLSNFAIPIICRTRKIRDELVEKCKDKIEIRPIVGGDMTRQPFFLKYMKKYSHVLKDSNAKLVHDQGLYFGNNPELTDEDKDVILKVFTK
jgi:CDP-6-deoxy-D-xylo-4-hexulose-3-dehydrase